MSLGHRRLDVVEVLDEWQGSDHRYFKVRVASGVVLIVRQNTDTGDWALTMYDGSVSSYWKSGLGVLGSIAAAARRPLAESD